MKNLEIKQTGFGQWNVSTIHRGKKLSIHFTDAPTYDMITSEDRGFKKAIKNLRRQIINFHK